MTRSYRLALTAGMAALGVALVAAAPRPAVQSETVTLRATLSPADEVPAITNAERVATGEVTVALHVTRDANRAVTGATADIEGSVKGFPAGSTLTAAHVHRGAKGANGTVAVNPGFTAEDLALDDGAASFSKKGVMVPREVAQELTTNPAGFYFNVHSQMNAQGVARGQLAAAASGQ